METTRELSPERVGELVADAATPVVHRALWAVLWDGELRLADALSADVRDVSFESGTITVDLPLRGRGPVALPMSDRTAALLREAIADRTEGPLLVSDSGNPLSREAAIRRAQTAGVGIHAFRYSGRLHREAPGRSDGLGGRVVAL
ncbi:tyrosine-type recombinase/integrase [Streptomyces kronopolitis]|uniref:tyrosine-type recombinase/integrase n=1 Tax=Streptomyces kronopolitis TaxID=1612435 RepID=UPI0034432328